jgi:beta-galactosidase
MRLRRNHLISVVLFLSLAWPSALFAATPRTGITVNGKTILLDGKPFKILSGELHYARIPREYWRARLRMARAMGLNTVATYVFWNIHEPKPGVYDFTGQYDLAAFIRMAQEEGLYVILRSGPYSCAEWDLGGLPAWLLATPESAHALRSNDPAFMQPVQRWVHRLAQEVVPLLYQNGGPIIMTQIENEYGNYGSDKAYMAHLHEIYVREGFAKSFLYTADNWRNIAKGDLPELFAATNFGINNHKGGMDALERERPGQPLFVSEYWPGWFDHWGHPHETRPVAPQIEDLEYILNRGVGINVYMFHGGTSFGFYAGATGGAHFLPDVTSYDYDAPLDEAGHPTAKFDAYRKVLAEYNPTPLPPIPPVAHVITLPAFTLTSSASIWDNLPAPIPSDLPLPMEHFGQSFGYILYRTTLRATPASDLVIDEVHDFACIYLDGRLIGMLDRRHDQHSTLRLPAVAAGARLDILVANDGRINSTRAMRTETKGITHSVTLNGIALTGWRVYPLPLGEPGTHRLPRRYARRPQTSAPTFYRGTFSVPQSGDVFLDVRNLGKGALWINGHPVGRFWNVGPQDTLYVPGPWLHRGKNDIVVFDLLPRSAGDMPRLAGLPEAILNGPTKEQTMSSQQ